MPRSCRRPQLIGAKLIPPRPAEGSLARRRQGGLERSRSSGDRRYDPLETVQIVRCRLAIPTPMIATAVPGIPPRRLVAERRGVRAPGPAGPPMVITGLAMEMPWRGTPWLVPARSRRMMVEVPGPGLGSQMPPGTVAVLHHLRRIVQDDLDAERGRQVLKTRAVAGRRGGRRHCSQGAEGRRQQQHLAYGPPPHGSPPQPPRESPPHGSPPRGCGHGAIVAPVA